MEYGQYFEYRQISPQDYKEYTIPKYLKRVLGEIEDPKILDFGCGFGQITFALRAAGFARLEGLDVSAPAIEHCKAEGLICHDGNDESFFEKNQSSYDFIILSHVVEHIPKSEIIPLLGKIRTLLTARGALIVMVPNAQSNTGCYWAYEDFTHHTMFTSGSLFYVLRSAGFATVEFLDLDSMEEVSGFWKRAVKKFFLKLYRENYVFWNRITASSIHKPSPITFGYEVKALARR